MINIQSLINLVTSFTPAEDGAAAKSRELVLGLLADTPSPLSRSQFAPGHITCSAVVLHPDRNALLLIHHKRLDRWLLPGGHVEPTDSEISAAARREVEEETAALLEPGSAPLIGIDVHGIPPKRGEPFHLHHDLVFAFRSASDAVQPAKEVHAAVWLAVPDLRTNPYHMPENIRLCAARALAALNTSR
jgi:8-oxo-dGTP pyrophosphatase MutT (NUDIX family)